MQAYCSHCGKPITQRQSCINRAQRERKRLFCNAACFGLSRRLSNPPTEAERKAAKSKYDALRRKEKAAEIKAKKAAHYQLTRDPVKEAAARKARMHLHVEYCRRPEYKAWKAEYDRRFRAKKDFGEYAEAALLLTDVEKEIDSRASRYDVYMSNGTLNKAQQRRRAL